MAAQLIKHNNIVMAVFTQLIHTLISYLLAGCWGKKTQRDADKVVILTITLRALM